MQSWSKKFDVSEGGYANEFLTSILLLLSVIDSVEAESIDVYVLAGQSSSLGTTADPGETDRPPGSKPAGAATLLFWDNVSPANSIFPISQRLGDSGGSITTLQAQQGEGGANPQF